MDYLKNWKIYSITYSFFIVELCFLFAAVYERLLTPINVFLIAFTILFCLFFYSRQSKSALHLEAMSRYDYKYLFTKSIDVFLQQMIILLLFYITNQNLLIFSSVFALAHVHLFINKKPLSVITFMLIAVLLSLVFYTTYANYAANGFGISYAIHMSIYLIGGIVFRFMYNTPNGKYT
jgi:hypothetical protein